MSYEPTDKIQPNPTVDEAATTIEKFSILKNTAAVWDKFLTAQTTSQRSKQSYWRTTSYDPTEKISVWSNGGWSVSGDQKLLDRASSLHFFLFFFFFLSTNCFLFLKKKLKVINIGLELHIASELNPTHFAALKTNYNGWGLYAKYC